eukprot:10443825-Alexandrium_andersonii.AAC.1
MSASLVGSEMCIRDRVVGVAGRRQQGQPLEQSLPVASRHRERPASGGAVSYTHLTLPTICSV